MKSLVTGGTGFVGSAIVLRLLQAGHEVRVLVRKGSNRRNIRNLPVEVCIGDLLDPSSLERAVEGCDVLFHAAADYRLWVRRPEEIYAVNVRGTRHLMNAALAKGVERVVYTSSVATLNLRPGGSVVDETARGHLEKMVGHYKRSKYLAEREVRRMIRTKGLPAVIVSPSTPVGPRDIRPTPTGRIVVDAVSGRMPAYVNTGLNLVHVDDVAEGHLQAFERGRIGENYILGGENLTLREILQEIAAIIGGTPPSIRLPHRLLIPAACLMEAFARLGWGEEPRLTLAGLRMSRNYMYFSAEKAKRELSFSPRAAREALGEAVEWFRQFGYCR